MEFLPSPPLYFLTFTPFYHTLPFLFFGSRSLFTFLSKSFLPYNIFLICSTLDVFITWTVHTLFTCTSLTLIHNLLYVWSPLAPPLNFTFLCTSISFSLIPSKQNINKHKPFTVRFSCYSSGTVLRGSYDFSLRSFMSLSFILTNRYSRNI